MEAVNTSSYIWGTINNKKPVFIMAIVTICQHTIGGGIVCMDAIVVFYLKHFIQGS